MKKGLPEGTGPPEWTQQPQISVSLQEGGGVISKNWLGNFGDFLIREKVIFW